MAAPRKFKIDPKTIPSDDCVVTFNRKYSPEKLFNERGEPVPNIIDPGITIYPHTGESICIIPASSIKGMSAILSLQQLEGDSDSAGSDAKKLVSVASKMDKAFNELCKQLSKQITSWDWTDMGGDPYDQPWNNPQVIAELSEDEIMYLINTVQTGENKEEVKKDDLPLEVTSSTEEQNHTQPISPESAMPSNVLQMPPSGSTRN